MHERARCRHGSRRNKWHAFAPQTGQGVEALAICLFLWSPEERVNPNTSTGPWEEHLCPISHAFSTSSFGFYTKQVGTLLKAAISTSSPTTYCQAACQGSCLDGSLSSFPTSNHPCCPYTKQLCRWALNRWQGSARQSLSSHFQANLVQSVML